MNLLEEIKSGGGGKMKWLPIGVVGVVILVLAYAFIKQRSGASAAAQSAASVPGGPDTTGTVQTMPGAVGPSDMSNFVGTVSTQYQDYLNKQTAQTAQQESWWNALADYINAPSPVQTPPAHAMTFQEWEQTGYTGQRPDIQAAELANQTGNLIGQYQKELPTYQAQAAAQNSAAAMVTPVKFKVPPTFGMAIPASTVLNSTGQVTP